MPDMDQQIADANLVMSIEAAEFVERWSKHLPPELADSLVTEVAALCEVAMRAMMYRTVQTLGANLRPDEGEQP